MPQCALKIVLWMLCAAAGCIPAAVQAQQFTITAGDTETFTATAGSASVRLLSKRSGISASELAVIVNTQDAQSVALANYYVSARQIPAANVIQVSFTPGQSNMPRQTFETLKAQVDAALPPGIQGFLLTWTTPWKVDCMSITSAFAFGFNPELCKPDLPGCQPTLESPYYFSSSTRPFQDFGIRPAMVLGATSVAYGQALVDRGIASDRTFPSGAGIFFRTSDQARSVRWPTFLYTTGNWTAGSEVPGEYFDNSSGTSVDYVSNRSNLLFYFTGLAQVPALSTLSFLPGATADHLTSYGGELTGTNQMSALRWLEAGATGSFGTVVEPCNYPEKFPDTYALLDRYYAGGTLLEAYWRSVYYPGEGVFVGEPLARPWAPKFTLNNAALLTVKSTVAPSQTLYLLKKDAPIPEVQGDVYSVIAQTTSSSFAVKTISATLTQTDYALFAREDLQPVTEAPEFTPIGDQGVDEGVTLSFRVAAQSSSGAPLTYSAENLPPGATFNGATRRFSWQPGFTQAGIYPGVLFSVSDGTQSDEVRITITVRDVNRPPVFSAIPAKSIAENQTLTFAVSAQDPDGAVLTYSASDLPDGAAFSSETRTFTWKPTFAQSGDYQVTFEVSDGFYSVTTTAAIAVTNANRAPELAAIGNKSVFPGTELRFTARGTDPDGQPLSFSANTLPAGAQFDAASGEFSWTPTPTQIGQFGPIRIQVSDGSLTDFEDISISVSTVNTAPQLIGLTDKLAKIQQTLTLTFSADDPEGLPVSITASALPQGSTFSATTAAPAVATFRYTPPLSAVGSVVSMTFTATDGVNSSKKTISITVVGAGAVPFDYDGDRKSDPAVYRPATAQFYTLLSASAGSTVTLGDASFKPVQGDFDGDGKVDRVVISTLNSAYLHWFVVHSSTGALYYRLWGLASDIPVIGDFNGNKRDEIAVFRNGVWYVLDEKDVSSTQSWGLPGDVPLAADFNGDLRADFTVFRPATGTWYVNTAKAGISPSNSQIISAQWGLPGDVPLTYDMTGDTKSDMIVWRPSTGTWYIRNSVTGQTESLQWGLPGDVPVIGDFNGDAKPDCTVFRPTVGTWFQNFRTGQSKAVQWGLPADLLPRR